MNFAFSPHSFNYIITVLLNIICIIIKCIYYYVNIIDSASWRDLCVITICILVYIVKIDHHRLLLYRILQRLYTLLLTVVCGLGRGLCSGCVAC